MLKTYHINDSNHPEVDYLIAIAEVEFTPEADALSCEVGEAIARGVKLRDREIQLDRELALVDQVYGTEEMTEAERNWFRY